MARADLILDLVRSALTGNKQLVRKITEAFIAEERTKQHTIFAERLEKELEKSMNSNVEYNNILNTITEKADNYFNETIPQKKLDSLILPNNVLKICHQFFEEQYRVDLLRAYGLEPRNKLLLVGPPGTGKTSLAEAIAESLMLPFITIKYESIIGSYLGETSSRLKKLIDYVRSRKCIFFLDEFETLGKERGDLHETGEIKRVVSSLLLQIDDLPNHVIIIGATNHPELLDKAVWRRFQIKLNLPLPSNDEIRKWLTMFQNRYNIYFDKNIENIINVMNGCSFADIEEFGFTILRKYILQLPNSDLNSIISDELKLRK